MSSDSTRAPWHIHVHTPTYTHKLNKKESKEGVKGLLLPFSLEWTHTGLGLQLMNAYLAWARLSIQSPAPQNKQMRNEKGWAYMGVGCSSVILFLLCLPPNTDPHIKLVTSLYFMLSIGFMKGQSCLATRYQICTVNGFKCGRQATRIVIMDTDWPYLLS